MPWKRFLGCRRIPQVEVTLASVVRLRPHPHSSPCVELFLSASSYKPLPSPRVSFRARPMPPIIENVNSFKSPVGSTSFQRSGGTVNDLTSFLQRRNLKFNRGLAISSTAFFCATHFHVKMGRCSRKWAIPRSKDKSRRGIESHYSPVNC